MDAKALTFDALNLGLHPPLALPVLGCNEQPADLVPVDGVERRRRQHRQVSLRLRPPAATPPRRHPRHEVRPVVAPLAAVELGGELGDELAEQRVAPVEHHDGVVEAHPVAGGRVHGLRADGVAEVGEGPENDDVGVEVDTAVLVEQGEAEEVGEVLPERDAAGADVPALHRAQPRLRRRAVQEVGHVRRGGGDAEAAVEERAEPVAAAVGVHGVGGDEEAGVAVRPEEALHDEELAAAEPRERGEPRHEKAPRARPRRGEELARARREPPRPGSLPEQQLEEALVPLRGRLLVALGRRSRRSRRRKRRCRCRCRCRCRRRRRRCRRRRRRCMEGSQRLVHGDIKCRRSSGHRRRSHRRGIRPRSWPREEWAEQEAEGGVREEEDEGEKQEEEREGEGEEEQWQWLPRRRRRRHRRRRRSRRHGVRLGGNWRHVHVRAPGACLLEPRDFLRGPFEAGEGRARYQRVPLHNTSTMLADRLKFFFKHTC